MRKPARGPVGSAWFAHFDGAGAVTHVDVRGPTFKGSLTGGAKSLFRLPPIGGPYPRLVLAEAAIDALSVAGIEGFRKDTLYAATGGGIGPGTVSAPEALLASMAPRPDALFCSAADANALAIALQIVTGLSRKNSAFHLLAFGLQSKVATGTTCFAEAQKREDRSREDLDAYSPGGMSDRRQNSLPTSSSRH